MTGSTTSIGSGRNSQRFNAATSRAMPAILRQSPRLGVNSISTSVSSKCNSSRTFIPGGLSGGNGNSPSELSARPSSLAEHNIPWDSIPRSLDFLMRNPPGNTAPIRAVGTHIPTATLGAPQTICSGSVPPVSTVATRNRSASGCGIRSITRPTTTCSKAGAAGSRLSTSRPAIVNCAASSALDTAGSTHSRSHCSLTFITFTRSYRDTVPGQRQVQHPPENLEDSESYFRHQCKGA